MYRESPAERVIISTDPLLVLALRRTPVDTASWPPSVGRRRAAISGPTIISVRAATPGLGGRRPAATLLGCDCCGHRPRPKYAAGCGGGLPHAVFPTSFDEFDHATAVPPGRRGRELWSLGVPCVVPIVNPDRASPSQQGRVPTEFTPAHGCGGCCGRIQHAGVAVAVHVMSAFPPSLRAARLRAPVRST